MSVLGHVGKLAIGLSVFVFMAFMVFYWPIVFVLLVSAFWLFGAWGIGNIICEIVCQGRNR